MAEVSYYGETFCEWVAYDDRMVLVLTAGAEDFELEMDRSTAESVRDYLTEWLDTAPASG